MKFILLAFVFSASSAIAAPAQKFSCSGVETYFQLPIEFEIAQEDWSDEFWYGYNVLEITSIDGAPSSAVIDLNEKVLKGCTAEQSYNELTVSPGAGPGWEVRFLRGCDAEVEYQIEATCKQIY